MKKKQLDIEWVIKNHFPFLQKFGLDEAKIREHYEVWKVGKISISINNYFWYILQNIIAAIPVQVSSEEQMYQLNYDTYFIMWEFLAYVESKNANHVKKLMHQNELKLWRLKQTNFKVEVVIISKGCCDYCESLNGKLISFEEALDKEYLASDKCSREKGCNCCYSVLNSIDENGELIRIT